MTDKEIIKALECCLDETDDICEKCPLYETCTEGTGDEIKQLALDLIIRLQEENKQYKAGVKRVEQEFRYWQEQRKLLEKGGRHS